MSEKVVDVEQLDRYQQYKNSALLLTLVVLGIAMLLLMIVSVTNSRKAIHDSRAAVLAGRVTDHNLCVQVKGILARDRKTIRGSPEQTAKTLRALGFSDARIDAFKKAQAPVIARELKLRPDVDCSKGAQVKR